MATPKTGRPSIFRGKAGGMYVQGIITKRGATLFEQHRRRLAKLAGRQPTQVSQADVIEALCHGWERTTEYFATLE